MTEVGDNEAATASAPPGSNNSQTPYLGPHSHSHGFTADCSQQNRLLWNLFSQGLDRLLINLLASSQKVSIDHLRQQAIGWLSGIVHNTDRCVFRISFKAKEDGTLFIFLKLFFTGKSEAKKMV